MKRTIFIACAAAAAFFADPAMGLEKTLDGNPPLVTGHRGAPGYLPEHTLEAYKLAIEMGVDFIEPDLVVTKDGVLVARHEPMLSGTTDVADRPEFLSRKVKRNVDGVEVEDWFAGDFTLAEIKSLKAKQAMADRDQSHNGKYAIPTFQEVIDLAKAESTTHGRIIGIYPETKHPTFHTQLGLTIEDKLVDALKAAGWTEKNSPVIIQSFEVGNLKYLRGKTNVRLVQLVDADGLDKDGNITLAVPSEQPYDFVVAGDKRTYKDLVTKAGLTEIKTYADGVAPWKPYIQPSRQVDNNNDGQPDDLNGDGKVGEQDRMLIEPTSVVNDAHAAGLFIHTWTFRSEPHRLASDYNNDPSAEYKIFYDLGIDGLFSDFPDAAIKARSASY